MAATPEAKVKAKVTKLLKARGAYYFYPVTGGYGGSGVPDIIACHRGRFIGIECKAGKNKPTKLQSRNAKLAKSSGAVVLVVNEANIDVLENVLDKVEACGSDGSEKLEELSVWPFDGIAVGPG